MPKQQGGLSQQELSVLEAIAQSPQPIAAATEDKTIPGEGTEVWLVVDYIAHNLPPKTLRSLWKKGYLEVENNILVPKPSKNPKS